MKKASLAAGAVALVMALSACGGGASTPGNAKALSDDTTLGSPFGDASALAIAASNGTQKAKSSKFTMEMNGGGQSVKGQGQARFDGNNTAMAMTMDVQGQQMEIRLLEKTLYIKVPEAQRSALGTDKPWVKIVPGGTDPMSKAIGGSFDQMTQQSDPSKMLEQISKAGKITKSEQTQLDGQPANHYTIDIELAKLADQMPGGLPQEAKAQLQGKDIHFPMDVWVNSDQLPLQIVMDMSSMMQALGAPASAGSMKVTAKYTDWGAPVDVQAPPADQVGTPAG
jgi:hypothetical protein